LKREPVAVPHLTVKNRLSASVSQKKIAGEQPEIMEHVIQIQEQVIVV